MHSPSSYSLADDATKAARKAPHQQAIANGISRDLTAFFTEDINDLPTKPSTKDPKVTKKVTMRSGPWNPYHRTKAAEFGDSVNQRVAVVPGDARSVQSAKKSMGPAAQLAVIAAVTSQRTNKKVTDMMITDAVAKVEPEGGINMLEALKVNKPTDVRAKRMQGERTITAKSEHKELLQNPFVFHFDLVSNTIEQCAGAREQDPVAFNTVCGVRKGVGVSYYSTLTPDRIDAIETAGRAFGPNWKFSGNCGTDWIMVQRSQGHNHGEY